MKKYHRSYSTCADVVQKNHDFIALRVFSSIDAASLPQNVYYRVIAVREGGHAPETRPASLDMPPERRTGPSYMRSGVVACPKRRDASPGRGPPHGR